jgi:4-hydroxybenzoate polyprenyltransferase
LFAIDPNFRPPLSDFRFAVASRIRVFFDLVKFEHTIFALPFAYLGMALASGAASAGWPGWKKFIWITVAMVAARTLAMSANRLVDGELDARNPRTVNRPLPRGLISSQAVAIYAAGSLGLLIVAAWQLDPLCLILLPGALVFLLGYHYTKRFTWLSHWILGFTDGLAAPGAWVAVRGSILTWADLPAWLLLAAVMFWIGGFDLIYACQDVDVDRREGLHSVPADYSVARALLLARLCHALTVALLAGVGWAMSLGWPFWVGLGAVAAMLIYEHSLVSPQDLSRLDLAFFNMNGYISITVFAATILSLWVQ